MWFVSGNPARPLELILKAVTWALTGFVCVACSGLLAEEYLPSFNVEDLESEYEFRTEDYVAPSSSGAIPSQGQRNEGPRILVEEIRFARLPEFPEHGLTEASVGAIVEARRQSLMSERERADTGFTAEEIAEIADYLDPLVTEQEGSTLNQDTVQDLVQILKRQRAQRGLTFNDIEAIAAEVTHFYRQQGLFLARAYVPAQEVTNGVVYLSVFEGRLGRVITDAEEWQASGYNEKLMASSLRQLVGRAVSSDEVEEEIYLLNDFAGVGAFGYFTRGDALGETNLKVRLRDQKKWALTSRTDNHGTKFSGDRRLYTVFDWFSPLGRGDTLSLGYLKSTLFDSDINIGDSDIGLFSYSLPLSPKTGIKLAAEYNKFSVNPDGDQILEFIKLGGINESATVSVWHKLVRSRKRNLTFGVALWEKETDISALIEPPENTQNHALGLEFSLNTDFLSEDPKVLNVFNVRMNYSQLQGEVVDGRSTDHYALSGDTSSLFFVKAPFTALDTRLLLHSKWQYSDSSLPGFNQLPLGGANTVRAFTTADFSADKLAFLSAEWFIPFAERYNVELLNQKLNNLLQVGGFIDLAYGEQNSFEPEVDTTTGQFAGVGLVMKLAWSDRFNSKISFALPVESSTQSNVGGELEIEEKTVRSYIDLSYRFH